MDTLKIDLFNKENGMFPYFRHLPENEILKQQKLLCESLHVCTIDTLMNKIGNMNFIPDFNANNEAEFQLNELFNTLGLNPLNVFINWYRFDDIDEISLKDLDQYFYGIWFPVVDDIDIFDDTFKWVVSISHDGIISRILAP